jgi:hypothetical protein
MPGDIECQLIRYLIIADVLQLLQYQHSDGGMEFLARSSHIFRKIVKNLGNRQLLQKKFAKYTRPASIQQLPPLGTNVIPQIKQVAGAMVFHGYHALSHPPYYE